MCLNRRMNSHVLMINWYYVPNILCGLEAYSHKVLYPIQCVSI
jgi:hypothetical protein